MAKTTKKTDAAEEIVEDAGAEPRVYELGFHLDAELAQEDVKKAYQAVRDLISEVGTIIAEGEPVKVPLAYTISIMNTAGRRDFNSAFFCWISYEADGAGHDKVLTMARENTRIIRFLDLRSSTEEAKHSADMQEIFAEQAATAHAEMPEDEVLSEAQDIVPVAPAAEEEAA